MEGILQFQLYHHQLVPTGGCIALIGLPDSASSAAQSNHRVENGSPNRVSVTPLPSSGNAPQPDSSISAASPAIHPLFFMRPLLLSGSRVRTSAASIIKSGQKKYNRRLWASFEQNISEINANLTPKQN